MNGIYPMPNSKTAAAIVITDMYTVFLSHTSKYKCKERFLSNRLWYSLCSYSKAPPLMLYHTEHQYRYSGYQQCRELLWFCVCYVLQKSKMRNTPCSWCSYTHFSDIHLHLTIAVTTPFIFIQELRNFNSHM